MLVVLNSSIATKRQYIAQRISYAINNLDNYPIGDFFVRYQIDEINNISFEIFNNDNEKVYGAGVDPSPLLTNEDGSANTDGIEIFNQANSLDSTKLYHHFYDDFADWTFYDYGLKEDGFDFTTQDILDVYNARNIDNLVVVGAFAKVIIEELKLALGDELHVINFVRNPSTMYLFNTDYEDRGHVSDDVIPYCGLNNHNLIACRYMNTEICSAIFSSIAVGSLDYVQQVKFEDVIANEQFTVGDKTVTVEIFNAYNAYVDQYEIDNVIPYMEADGQLAVKQEDLSLFNSIVSDMNANITHETDNTFKDEIHTNYFETLGYTPLDYSTIISNA